MEHLRKTQQTMLKTIKLRHKCIHFYDNFEHKDKISKTEYRLITKTFLNLLRKSMLYEGKVYKLPEGIGMIGIFMTGQEKNYYNFQHYKETGQKIPIRNRHTERKQFGIKYVPGDKYISSVPLNFVFKFKANRSFARELAAALKSKNTSSLYLPYELYLN